MVVISLLYFVKCVADSGFLSGIDVGNDIPCGARLELRWNPGRHCIIQKTVRHLPDYVAARKEGLTEVSVLDRI